MNNELGKVLKQSVINLLSYPEISLESLRNTKENLGIIAVAGI
jgi:hypothetical protein